MLTFDKNQKLGNVLTHAHDIEAVGAADNAACNLLSSTNKNYLKQTCVA